MPVVNISIPWASIQQSGAALNRFIPSVNVEVRSMTTDALRELKRLTPKSQLTGPHIADQWIADYRMGRDIIREVVIRNTTPLQHVLEYLEGGTKAHRIPREGENTTLRFMAQGTEVFSANVYHPGTKAYRMVEVTHLALERRVSTMISTVIDRMSRGNR